MTERRKTMTKFRFLFISIVLIGSLIIGGCTLFGGDEAPKHRYIVTFKVDVEAIITSLVLESIQVEESFALIDGVLAILTDKQIKWMYDNLPVRYIEPDMLHSIPEPLQLEAPAELQADTEIGWEIKMINAQAAWGRTKGQGVKVGVIDTGVDPNHPDLQDAVIGGYNGITDSHEGWEDDQGHGTSVAGAIAGRKNGTGIVGIAPLAEIYVLKGLNSSGSGYTSWLLRCFQKALVC